MLSQKNSSMKMLLTVTNNTLIFYLFLNDLSM